LIGTAGRLLYLGGLLLGLCWLLHPVGAPSLGALQERSLTIWLQQRPLLLTVLVGLEASAWLHLLQDGDPIPKTPRLLRRRGRRRHKVRR
jgi:uncharacterized metal-binding protein